MSEEQENKTEDSTAKLQEELTKAKNDYLYLLAEFDNYRKNAIKERSDLTKYGAERFMRDFLGIFDNFELALNSEINQENLSSFREGVQMIAGEIRSLLQRHGVEEVKAEGKPFDPSQHEAVSTIPAPDQSRVQLVSATFQPGYRLKGMLVRPARVQVYSDQVQH